MAVVAGATHSLALRADGTVVAWPADDLLPMPANLTNLTNVVAVAAGASHDLALRADGTVNAWGAYPAEGSFVGVPVTPPFSLSNVVAVASGFFHNLALVGNGPSALRAVAVNPRLSGSGFSLQIATRSGGVYALEYKTNVTDTNWVALPLVPGNGGAQTLTDPTATGASRFYRVRAW